MDFLKDFKYYIVVILITLVLGYFLGLTVAGVVDYRLKDTIINLPKPRNNIIIQLDSEKLNKEGIVKETFVGNRHVKKPSKKIRIEHFENNKDNLKNNLKDKKKNEDIRDKPSDILESKDIVKSTAGYKRYTDKTNLNREPFTIDNPGNTESKKYYGEPLQDPNVNAYSLAYNITKQIDKVGKQQFGYLPSNFEDYNFSYKQLTTADDYQEIRQGKYIDQDESTDFRPAPNRKNVKYAKKRLDKTAEYPELPLREKRCPNFKCQRVWENCVNKPNIILDTDTKFKIN